MKPEEYLKIIHEDMKELRASNYALSDQLNILKSDIAVIKTEIKPIKKFWAFAVDKAMVFGIAVVTAMKIKEG